MELPHFKTKPNTCFYIPQAFFKLPPMTAAVSRQNPVCLAKNSAPEHEPFCLRRGKLCNRYLETTHGKNPRKHKDSCDNAGELAEVRSKQFWTVFGELGLLSKTRFCFYSTSTITGVVPKSLLPLYSFKQIILTVPAVKEPVFSSSMKWSTQWCQAVLGLDHSIEKLQFDLLQDKHMDWKDTLLRIREYNRIYLSWLSDVKKYCKLEYNQLV